MNADKNWVNLNYRKEYGMAFDVAATRSAKYGAQAMRDGIP
jgi:hypothetical protein